MLKIDYAENFDEIDKIADELLSEYDTENGIEYNFKRFAFVAKDNNKTVGYVTGFKILSADFQNYSFISSLLRILPVNNTKCRCIQNPLISTRAIINTLPRFKPSRHDKKF